jgi:hypothetical protein
MDKFSKFVDGELAQFPISKRLESRLLSLVQVWASAQTLSEISAAACVAEVGITDLETSLLIYRQEEEEEEAWPPF